MRLYSRSQLIARVGIAVVASLVGGGFLAWLVLPAALGSSSQRQQLSQPEAIPATPIQWDKSSTRNADFTGDELNNIELYERVNAAVVNITSVTIEYSWFLEPIPREGTGSGVIIDQQGHVITNYHVVKDASQLNLTLSDGTEVEGRVVGTDPENDLAVISFDPKGRTLTTVPFGTSSNLRVGQKVLAVGNPFGFERTLTTGIVSGLGRPIQTEDGYVIREMVQTDAAINPGNSGGPLLNSMGEIIGINTMIYSPSGASAGVGFAVPVNTVKRVAEELVRYGVVRRGWIEIEPVQLFPTLVRYAKLPVQKGILVSQASGNALQAGLRGGDSKNALRYGRSIIYLGGDIITEVNRQKVQSLADFLGALESTKPGEIVEVKVLRGTQEKTFSVKLVEQKK